MDKFIKDLLRSQYEIERTILGEIMLLGSFEKQLEAIIDLTNVNFEHSAYKRLIKFFIKMLTIDKVQINQVTVATIDLNLAKEMNALNEGIFSPVNLSQHIKNLKDLVYKRKILSQIESNILGLQDANTYKEFENEKNSLITSLSGMNLEKDSEFIDFNELEEQLISSINKKKSNSIDGYSFGVNELDVYSNGLQQSKFYVIGGLKKAGKTRFLIHLIRELYLQNVSSAFLSLEIPKYDLYKLLKASFIGIEDVKLRSGGQKYLTSEELSKIETMQFDENKLMIECTSGIGIGEVISRLRKYAKLGAKIVFIDFLQRINVDIKNKVNELEAMAQLLSNASRELNIGIVLLSQLNNLAEKEVPSISHLKGSGGIGEAADTIMVLDNVFRRTGGEDNKNLIELELTQRYGESGKIKMYGDLGACLFRDYTKLFSKEEMRKGAGINPQNNMNVEDEYLI